MTAPIEVSGTEAQSQPEAVLAGIDKKAIEGRSLGQIAWLRLKRDKVALAGGAVVLLLIIVAVLGPLVVGDPDLPHGDLIDPVLQRPKDGVMHSGISPSHPLGLDVPAGRDMLSRIVNGAKYSLLISFLSTLVAVAIGVVMGIVAGYFGGWVDTVIARTMDVFLAFPLLLFAIALVGVIPGKLDVLPFGPDFLHMMTLDGNGLRVVLLVIIIGFFGWPYIGRIIRGQTLSLREREFVDAARSMGARSPYILFKELLPNLWAPILVYATLLIPTNILFEAALSFLGVGIIPPTPTWGGMLSDAVERYEITPHFMFFPGMAIFITVLAFNLFGDGLRDALDPRASR